MKLLKEKKEFFIILAIFIISLIMFITLCIVLSKNGGELNIDNRIRDKFYDTRGSKKGFVYYLYKIITELGNTYVTTIVLVSILIYTRFNKGFFCIALGIFLGIVLHLLIKDIFDRDRPYEYMMWANEKDKSFPSGHTTNASILYGFIIYYLFKNNYINKIKYPTLIIGIFIIILVMISRLVLGCHYFTDVLGGLSLGLMILSFIIFLYNLMTKLEMFNEPLLKFKKRYKNEE